MSTQPIDYAAILADLEAKKGSLETAIASVRAAIAAGSLGQSGDGATFTSPGFSSALAGGEVPAGAFLGKSIPDAAKLYLEIVKKKQTSKEIAEALLKGGMESTSKNFPSIVHAILDRARKAKNPALVKVDKSHWGLTGWWPKGIGSANGIQSKKLPKKKAAKKADGTAKAVKVSATVKPDTVKAEPISTAPSVPLNPIKEVSPNTKLVMSTLQAKPGNEFTVHEIAKETKIDVQNVNRVIANLVRGRKVEKISGGKYRAAA
jgi:hypothetical protein